MDALAAEENRPASNRQSNKQAERSNLPENTKLLEKGVCVFKKCLLYKINL
jgi:hypothetical protein